MELVIQGRNLQVSESLREYVSKKVIRLQRHLAPVESVKVEFTEDGARAQDQRAYAQIVVDVKGSGVLTGEQRGATPYAAFDVCLDVMDTRLQRHKAKSYRTERAKRSRETSPRFQDGATEPEAGA